MRYRCVVSEQECVVEVELSSDRARATIYSVEPEVAPLHAYNVALETARVHSLPDGFEERIAREALANYVAGDDAFKPGHAFAGTLEPLP